MGSGIPVHLDPYRYTVPRQHVSVHSVLPPRTASPTQYPPGKREDTQYPPGKGAGGCRETALYPAGKDTQYPPGKGEDTQQEGVGRLPCTQQGRGQEGVGRLPCTQQGRGQEGVGRLPCTQQDRGQEGVGRLPCTQQGRKSEGGGEQTAHCPHRMEAVTRHCPISFYCWK